MVEKEKSMKKLVLQAVDEGLLTLGESCRKAIYFHLENSYRLKREDIPEKPEYFDKCLKRIFGAGAKVIERAIIKSLHKKLGIEHFEGDEKVDFVKRLKELKVLAATA